MLHLWFWRLFKMMYNFPLCRLNGRQVVDEKWGLFPGRRSVLGSWFLSYHKRSTDNRTNKMTWRHLWLLLSFPSSPFSFPRTQFFLPIRDDDQEFLRLFISASSPREIGKWEMSCIIGLDIPFCWMSHGRTNATQNSSIHSSNANAWQFSPRFLLALDTLVSSLRYLSERALHLGISAASSGGKHGYHHSWRRRPFFKSL